MRVQGLQKLTLLDYPERVACTVFTAGCNFRCPFCHNASLVTHIPERADVDEEATADRRETVLGTKQTEYFNNVLKAWLEEYPLNVNAAIWADVVFDRSYETKAN